MSYMDKSIKELHELLVSGKVTSDELVKEAIENFVETQAPTYVEDGETKYYSLLNSPVEVQVSATSEIYSKDSTTQVINKKGFKLPLTGGNLNIIPVIAGIAIVAVAIIIKKKDKKNEEKIQEN